MVIAGADLIEYGRVNLYSERSSGILDDVKRQFKAVAQQVKRDLGLISKHPILNNVPHCSAINRKYLISGKNPKQISRRSWSHRNNYGYRG
jgi:hypothetical protein